MFLSLTIGFSYGSSISRSWNIWFHKIKVKVKQSHYRPSGFQEVEVPRFEDNGHMKVLSRTHWPPLPPGDIPGTHFC
jgi:hypothetical protein